MNESNEIIYNNISPFLEIPYVIVDICPEHFKYAFKKDEE